MFAEWISKAGSLNLKTVLQIYLDLVQRHILKMDDFFDEEGISFLSISNRVMQAFIEDANEKQSICIDTEVNDACLLACIQNINHFKISMYGTATAFAKLLSMKSHAAVFYEAEVNEMQIDGRLSQLAEQKINRKANAPFVIQG